MGSVVIDEVAQTCTFVDVTVTFPYGGSVSESKVGTITITGAQGVSNILMGLEGAGGPPSPPSEVTVTYIEYNETPADPVVTVVDPGGPGEAADWTLALEIPKGAPGDATPFALEDATDLTGTVEVATANYHVTVNATGDGFELTAPPLGDVLWPTSISSTASSNTTPRTLATCSITAGRFPTAVRFDVSATCVVTGSSDVRVDLIAYLGDPDAGGQEIGRGIGVALGTAGTDRVILHGNIPTASASSWGRLDAGAASALYLRAINQGNASANWSTSNTSTTFWAQAIPVP